MASTNERAVPCVSGNVAGKIAPDAKSSTSATTTTKNSFTVKAGLAQMLKGGVISKDRYSPPTVCFPSLCVLT